MARKSREVRLQQTQAKLDEYKAAGLDFLREVSFLGDMVYRLERKKGLTPRRREWLDNLIDSPVPAPKNPELWDRIMRAGNAPGLDARTSDLLLKDFAVKAFKGWEMSDRQVDFLNNLIEKAEHILENGPYRPDPKIIARLKLAHVFSSGRGTGYWMNKPGERKAFECVGLWLGCEGENIPHSTENVLTEWHVNKLLHSARVPLREIDNPTFKAGDMINYRSDPALVITGPHAGEHAEAYYTLLAGGDMVEASIKVIKKRLRKC